MYFLKFFFYKRFSRFHDRLLSHYACSWELKNYLKWSFDVNCRTPLKPMDCYPFTQAKHSSSNLFLWCVWILKRIVMWIISTLGSILLQAYSYTGILCKTFRMGGILSQKLPFKLFLFSTVSPQDWKINQLCNHTFTKIVQSL